MTLSDWALEQDCRKRKVNFDIFQMLPSGFPNNLVACRTLLPIHSARSALENFVRDESNRYSHQTCEWTAISRLWNRQPPYR
jgi:hypothetical protein